MSADQRAHPDWPAHENVDADFIGCDDRSCETCYIQGAVCDAGHPLTVRTKGTFWITVDRDQVVRAVVIADAGFAGNLAANQFDVWGCSQSDCNAHVTDAARAAAIAAADSSDWPLKHIEGQAYVEMEG